jgi:hypothetical protein
LEKVVNIQGITRVLVGFLSVSMTACVLDESTEGNGGATTSVEQYSSSISSRAIEPGGICANGGVEVESGIDENGNGLLDVDEVDNRKIICNGENGKDSLIDVLDVEAGEICAEGGLAIRSGVDDNTNNILDDSEVNSISYLCGNNQTPVQEQPVDPNDQIKPEIISTLPSNNALSVPTDVGVRVEFSEAMDQSSINTSTFFITNSQGYLVSGEISYENQTAVFSPYTPFVGRQVYTAQVTDDVTDINGNSLDVTHSWFFTIGNPPDLTSPTIVSRTPESRVSFGVRTNTNITITFSEGMDESSLNISSIVLNSDDENVAGSVTYSNLKATFTPDDLLEENTMYSAIVTTGARDLAGNGLRSAYRFEFTTGGVPTEQPESLKFYNKDYDASEVAGTVYIEAPEDDGNISSYVLYWADENLDKLDLPAAGSVLKTSSFWDAEFTFADDSPVPVGATHLLVYSANTHGESLSALPVALDSYVGDVCQDALDSGDLSGNYMCMVSEPGDYIGGGNVHYLLPITATISNEVISVSYSANGSFNVNFENLQDVPLTVEVYTGATRYPFNGSGAPGLSASGFGRGCNRLTGSFEIFEVEFDADHQIEKFAANFEQHCEGGDNALFGYVRFNSNVGL